jgi:pyrroloquinoline-quinone synthase
MDFALSLQSILTKYDLLTHQFYQYWNEGKLSKSTLDEYAKQYYHHVEAFPKCLSAIHSKCDFKEARKIILENLIEEEFSTPNHPQLWLNFAKGLGIDEQDVLGIKLSGKTKELLETFKECCDASYEQGIGALYAHEWQYSKIAETKKDGLKKFYNLEYKEDLEFFTIHEGIDVWHAEQLTTILNKLPQTAHAQVKLGAEKAAQSLWGFLDGMLEFHQA